MGQKQGDPLVTLCVSPLNWAILNQKKKNMYNISTLLAEECMFHFLVWQMKEKRN